MRLLGNLYCYIWSGRGNNCNSYLFANVLRGDRPHVLIDPGMVTDELNERCLDNLITLMGRDGINAEDIGLVINTHSHPDHCEANGAIVERTRAKESKVKQALVCIHEDEVEHHRMMSALLSGLTGKEMRLEPDFYLKEGELVLGKDNNRIELEIIHTPGHSPGSISIYWPDKKVLISGDVLFNGAVGRTDFPTGDSGLLKRSIERLSKLDIDYLLPGHNTEFGNIISGKQNVEQNFAFVRLNYFPLL